VLSIRYVEVYKSAFLGVGIRVLFCYLLYFYMILVTEHMITLVIFKAYCKYLYVYDVPCVYKCKSIALYVDVVLSCDG
jgi:hypothetical protein